MGLAEKKQMEILNKVREIEDVLTTKFKASKEGTFGSKIKQIQNKIENQFFVNAVWAMVQIRNAMIHTGDYEIGMAEYKLFKNNYDYIKSVLPKTKMKSKVKSKRASVSKASKKRTNSTTAKTKRKVVQKKDKK